MNAIAYAQQFPIKFYNMNFVTILLETINYESPVCIIFSLAFLTFPLVVL
jgi:hypothetical protein